MANYEEKKKEAGEEEEEEGDLEGDENDASFHSRSTRPFSFVLSLCLRARLRPRFFGHND